MRWLRVSLDALYELPLVTALRRFLAPTRRSGLRALQGAVLGTGAPLGWMAVQVFLGADPFADLHENPGVYIYMLAGTSVVFACFGWYVGRHEARFAQIMLEDPLTGLMNARGFWNVLTEQFELCRRNRLPIALIMADLDRFKRINDRYGHLLGNVVLAGCAQAMNRERRRGEFIARVGGEEFCVIIPGGNVETARQAAERIRQAVGTLVFGDPEGGRFSISISLGVAAAEPWRNPTVMPEMLFKAADEAMYEAKRQGRNRTVTLPSTLG